MTTRDDVVEARTRRIMQERFWAIGRRLKQLREETERLETERAVIDEFLRPKEDA